MNSRSTVLHHAAGRFVTLDETWREAERLGDPKLERDGFGGHRYSAVVQCRTKAGSLCFARGKGDDPITALAEAILEARRILG